jgi:hypothetical protein
MGGVGAAGGLVRSEILAKLASDITEATLLCERCGYVLEGLDERGACPECGQPIAESLPSRRTFKNFVSSSKIFTYSSAKCCFENIENSFPLPFSFQSISKITLVPLLFD